MMNNPLRHGIRHATSPKGRGKKRVTKHAAGRPYYAFYALRGTKGYARKRKTTRFTSEFLLTPLSNPSSDKTKRAAPVGATLLFYGCGTSCFIYAADCISSFGVFERRQNHQLQRGEKQSAGLFF